MNVREKLSVLLLLLGLLLALLPLGASRSFTGKPGSLLTDALDDESYVSVDQVARFIASEDTSVLLIDLRSPAEFMNTGLPGSVNIPYADILKKDPETYLGSGSFRNVFYSNGDLNSNYAVVIAAGLGYKNCYAMKGGMNEWIKTVMNARFSGDKISARENAIFEARTRAAKLFTEMNSLPDSLKIKYLSSKRFNPKKLDGGCE